MRLDGAGGREGSLKVARNNGLFAIYLTLAKTNLRDRAIAATDCLTPEQRLPLPGLRAIGASSSSSFFFHASTGFPLCSNPFLNPPGHPVRIRTYRDRTTATARGIRKPIYRVATCDSRQLFLLAFRFEVACRPVISGDFQQRKALPIIFLPFLFPRMALPNR